MQIDWNKMNSASTAKTEQSDMIYTHNWIHNISNLKRNFKHCFSFFDWKSTIVLVVGENSSSSTKDLFQQTKNGLFSRELKKSIAILLDFFVWTRIKHVIEKYWLRNTSDCPTVQNVLICCHFPFCVLCCSNKAFTYFNPSMIV